VLSAFLAVSSASEMTYIVSGGALNSTNSTPGCETDSEGAAAEWRYTLSRYVLQSVYIHLLFTTNGRDTD